MDAFLFRCNIINIGSNIETVSDKIVGAFFPDIMCVCVCVCTRHTRDSSSCVGTGAPERI